MKFGLITQDTDVEELVGLVQSTGRDVEESSRVSQRVHVGGGGVVESSRGSRGGGSHPGGVSVCMGGVGSVIQGESRCAVEGG